VPAHITVLVRAHLPIDGKVTEVRLMMGPPADGRWETIAVYPMAHKAVTAAISA
jgi:hypothetical protein